MSEIETKVVRAYDGADIGLTAVVAFLFGMMVGALLISGVLL